jgi:transglutaminase-like putative cysteine protease
MTRTRFALLPGFLRPAPLFPLPHGSLPWLMAAAFLTALPHIFSQPSWLSLMVTGILCLTLWKWKGGYKVSRSWFKVLLILVSLTGIWLEFRSFLNYEAGIALLILSVVMKLLELKSRRDAVVVVILSYFLLLTYYFYSQSLAAALWLLAGPLVITAALLRLYDDPSRPSRALLRASGRLVLQALPLLALLYLFFPRVTGPLWGLPQEGFIARTGLAEILDPGSIASLVQNREVAFRVQFHDPIPTPDKLYWRGLVLDAYNGREWRASQYPYGQPSLDRLEMPVRYTSTLEAHNQRWIFPLDIAAQPPQSEHLTARVTRNGVVVSRNSVTSRKRMQFTSYLRYRLEPEADPSVRANNLRLPPTDPQTKALARSWRAENPDPRWLARRALRFFREENFIYTLTPQALGQNMNDDFLFVTRRGFCEHYASAFALLMRAAGVPARIVTGYAGGELNPIDGHFVVRQSDAHAWVEIWLEGEGWFRIDPTSVIPPSRTESGAASERAASAPWLAYFRYRWEAVNNAWNQWVLSYTPEQQSRSLAGLGFQGANWRTLGLILGITFGIALLFLAVWLFRPRRENDPARAIWREAEARLKKQGIAIFPWETPLALARRLETEAPRFYRAVFVLARLVSEARYGVKPPETRVLHAALNAVPRFAQD